MGDLNRTAPCPWTGEQGDVCDCPHCAPESWGICSECELDAPLDELEPDDDGRSACAECRRTTTTTTEEDDEYPKTILGAEPRRHWTL